MLREFIGERKIGLLFCSRTGKPQQQSNILRRWLQGSLVTILQINNFTIPASRRSFGTGELR